MKKIYIITIITLILLLSFCNQLYSNATTHATVYLQANKEYVEVGEEVEISFFIKGQKTSAFNAIIYFDDTKLELVTLPENSNVKNNEIKILWYDAKGGRGAKDDILGKIKFKAKNRGLTNFVIDGEFYTEKGQLIQNDFKSLQVQIGKQETILEKQAREEIGNSTQTNNANLQSLRLDIEGLIPSFESDKYEYDLTVGNDITNIEVLAVSENPNAKIEILGNTRLKERNKYYNYKGNV